MLKLGKTYEMRNGESVTIDDYEMYNDEDIQPWRGDNGFWYTDDGCVNTPCDTDHFVDGFDIMNPDPAVLNTDSSTEEVLDHMLDAYCDLEVFVYDQSYELELTDENVEDQEEMIADLQARVNKLETAAGALLGFQEFMETVSGIKMADIFFNQEGFNIK
jgi:hypothetical protein